MTKDNRKPRHTRQELFDTVMELMGWDFLKTDQWFRTRNPNFGYISPDFLIKRGRIDRVAQFIYWAIEDQTPPSQGGLHGKKEIEENLH